LILFVLTIQIFLNIIQTRMEICTLTQKTTLAVGCYKKKYKKPKENNKKKLMLYLKKNKK